ncbi:MAG: hypothetical protein EHM81_11610 [Chloroflexi bacterium]|nr:MAG: hypothetical protein EHM81_11610 [Chloroflexota bacterium]
MPEAKTYKPELLPRRGEYTAWALAFAAALGLYILVLRNLVPSWTWFFVAFLFFSAISISLGNWMDRHTFIQLQNDGVVFENGLRKVRLAWDAVKEVRTFPARWGTAVQVLGEQAHFEFNTLGEVEFRGEVRGRVGFAQGKEIMDEILRATNLISHQKTDKYDVYTRP